MIYTFEGIMTVGTPESNNCQVSIDSYFQFYSIDRLVGY